VRGRPAFNVHSMQREGVRRTERAHNKTRDEAEPRGAVWKLLAYGGERGGKEGGKETTDIERDKGRIAIVKTSPENLRVRRQEGEGK